MARNVIPLAPAGARDDDERKRQLFAWADGVLRDLGLVDRIARANDLNDLRKIVFKADDAVLAIREALHPTNGRKAGCFEGLREKGLKLVLKNRFDEMKKDRAEQLPHGGGESAGIDWTDELILDKDGGVRPLLANLILFLRHHQDWAGVLGFDEFAARVVVRQRPPWGEEWPDEPWTDHHESETRIWFQREGISATLGDVGRAVQNAARYKSFHPVRDYLDSLVWDGEHRIDTWLITYFHADDTPYVRTIGPRYLISAVARVRKPGCKVDHSPVFEGPQGKQKSEALRALAVRSNWFADRLSNVGTKDALIETAGVWFIELSEMTAVLNASAGAKKSYLTQRDDRYRPPHGKHPIRRPCRILQSARRRSLSDGRHWRAPALADRLSWPDRSCRNRARPRSIVGRGRRSL
jgi:hypothetical protein